MYISVLSNNPGGNGGLDFSRRMWLGVNASKSSVIRYSLMHLLFKMDSISQKSVCSSFSPRLCGCSIENKTCLTIQIRLSQTLPWCEDAEGLTLHWIPFLFWFQAYCNYLWAPSRLVPLSEWICFTWPHLLINLLRALKQESVSKVWATSRCTALRDMHDKLTPYLFTKLWKFFLGLAELGE